MEVQERGVRFTCKGARVTTKKSSMPMGHAAPSKPSVNRSSNDLNRMLSTMNSSRFANLWPTQFAAPNEKGMNADVSCFSSFESGSHRSGRNWSGCEK